MVTFYSPRRAPGPQHLRSCANRHAGVLRPTQGASDGRRRSEADITATPPGAESHEPTTRTRSLGLRSWSGTVSSTLHCAFQPARTVGHWKTRRPLSGTAEVSRKPGRSGCGMKWRGGGWHSHWRDGLTTAPQWSLGRPRCRRSDCTALAPRGLDFLTPGIGRRVVALAVPKPPSCTPEEAPRPLKRLLSPDPCQRRTKMSQKWRVKMSHPAGGEGRYPAGTVASLFLRALFGSSTWASGELRACQSSA